jgi:exosortase K
MNTLSLRERSTQIRLAQLGVVLLGAFTLKLFYSAASSNELRWILAPTTVMVEVVTGMKFEFESHAGYMSSDHTFLIAASCAGVNFLVTSFLMLALRKLWREQRLGWTFIPYAAVTAYIATLIANTVRIATALRMKRMSFEVDWLDANQLHRLEGIFVYFGFLLLLYLLTEKSDGASSLARRSLFPLLVYYATMLGLPLANGAYRQGSHFWEHAAFVLLTPLVVILPLIAVRLSRGAGPLFPSPGSRSVSGPA